MEEHIEPRMVGGDDSPPEVRSKHIPHYYENEGRGIEDIVRCAGCSRLVILHGRRAWFFVAKFSPQKGCPRCGSSKFNDVKLLSGWERFLFAIRWLNFPDLKKFLAEFSRV